MADWIFRLPGMDRLRERVHRILYSWGPGLMSRIRKRWLLFTHPHANIVFEGPVHIGRGFSVYIPGPGTLIVGPGVEFRNGFRAEIVAAGRVVIGARTVLSYNTLIQCTSSIEIGEGVGIGQSTAFFDGNHNYRDIDTPFFDQGFELRPLKIGDHAAILTKCTVLNDVGDHAVVGANSVVTKPVPAYSVAGGVPARLLDYFGPEGQEPPELAERVKRSKGEAA